MPFVVDNSIVVGWHLDNQATPYSDEVLNALAGDTGHVPALWALEFSNVVRKALLAKKITETRAREIMQIQASLALTVHGDIPVAAENMALALRYRLSSYDAAYLDLALRLRLPMATADRALHDASFAAGVGAFTP